MRDPNVAHNVAVGFAEYDHDGRVDVVTARTDGSNLVLYRNEIALGTAGWLHVAIETGDAELETTDGIGARVAVGTGACSADDQRMKKRLRISMPSRSSSTRTCA